MLCVSVAYGGGGHQQTNSSLNIWYCFLLCDHNPMRQQMLGDCKRESVQRDFLKYTGQQILAKLREMNSSMASELYVGSKDCKYQVWERNALSLHIWNPITSSFKSLDYIHQNPVSARLCRYAEDYYFSSTRFYFRGTGNFDFLVHYNG